MLTSVLFLTTSSEDASRLKRGLYGGVTVNAKVSASAGIGSRPFYSDLQRPISLPLSSPYYARTYPAVAPFSSSRGAALIKVPNTVAVPTASVYPLPLIIPGQTVLNTARGHPYYYPYYTRTGYIGGNLLTVAL